MTAASGAGTARDVGVLFAPASVAVVGASADPAKWGYWLARGALEGRDRRAVHLVNRSGGEVLGHPTVGALRDLPLPPELVVVAVPPAAYEGVVDEALRVGARGVVGVTSGVPADVSRRVSDRVRAAGAVLLGPNCMGVADSHAGLRLVWGELPAGSIGLLSQSGNLAIELGRLAGREGLGFSRFASLGNEADLTAADLLAAVAQDPGTEVVAMYLEDFTRSRELGEAAQACIESGTPVALLAAGRSDVARRAAASHTGALAGSRSALEAVCRAAGVALVDTPSELVDVAHALTARARLGGPRIGVVGDGGGHGVVAADLLAARGFEVPTFGADLAAELTAPLPATASAANPVDLAGGGEQDHMSYARTVRTVLASGAVDAALLTGYFGAYGSDEPRLVEREAEVARAIVEAVVSSGRPTVVHSVAPDSPTCEVLRAGGVPVLRRVEGAVAGLAGLRSLAGRDGVPALPAAGGATPQGDAYLVARELLAGAGVAFPGSVLVASADEAAAAADRLGLPVVLKALDLAHKTDVGGVVLGLRSPEAVAAAYAEVTARLGERPVVVESMVTDEGVELIVGARRDLGAGPVVMVGLGGVQAEVHGDVAVSLAPVDRAGALRMLARLRVMRLLAGHRSGRPVDLDAVAGVVAAVSQVLAERPDLEALEVNPVLATVDRAVALDAHLDRLPGATQ